MKRGFPSMTALLGLAAVAGYQNRHKIAEWLGNMGQQSSTPGGDPRGGQTGGLSGLLRQLGQSLGGQGFERNAPGGFLSGPHPQPTDRFRQSGQAGATDPWIGAGSNGPVTSAQIEQAIDPEVLEQLSKQTGLSRQEIVARLSRELAS